MKQSKKVKPGPSASRSRTNMKPKPGKGGRDVNKNPVFGTKAAREAAKKAAEEEKKRLAAEAEEARKAAEKMEKERQKTATMFTSEDDKRSDIIKWLSAIPLSETNFKRVDRVFSDGSLVAEIINYYNPTMCDKRQYFKWVSNINKITNWEALNYKVFPKLGFKLTPKQIDNLLRPWRYGTYQENPSKGFYIFELLTKVRESLGSQNPSVYDYRKGNFKPPKSEAPVEPVSRRRRLSNLLDEPIFSRIQNLLEAGFYDKDGEKEKSGETGFEQVDEEMELPQRSQQVTDGAPQACSEAEYFADKGAPILIPCEYLTARSYTTRVDNWADAIHCQPASSCFQNTGSCFLF